MATKTKKELEDDLKKTIQDYNDAIFKVIQQFTDPKFRDDFRGGLSAKDCEVLRNLNVLRIDYGDTREP